MNFRFRAQIPYSFSSILCQIDIHIQVPYSLAKVIYYIANWYKPLFSSYFSSLIVRIKIYFLFGWNCFKWTNPLFSLDEIDFNNQIRSLWMSLIHMIKSFIFSGWDWFPRLKTYSLWMRLLPKIKNLFSLGEIHFHNQILSSLW